MRLALVLLICGLIFGGFVTPGSAEPKSVPADYPPTSRYGGGVLSNGSNAEILIAGPDSENRGVKSIIQALDGFLLANTRNSDRNWWLSTSGSISVIEEEDGVRAIIPGVAVVFNLGKEEAPLEFGDLELQFRTEPGELLNIVVQIPSRIVLRNPNGTVGFEIRIGSSKFSLIWDPNLKTIIGNHINFQDVSFRSKDKLIAQVERIESIGKLDERQNGFWSGSLTFRMENLVSTIIKIEEVESKETVKNLRLREFTTAMKGIDHDGRFGSWLFGGAFYPTSLYKYSISKDNIVSFIDATKKFLPVMGDISVRAFLRNLSMLGVFSVTDVRSQSDYRHEFSGLGNLAGQLRIEGIHVSTKGGIVAFQDLIPSSVNLDINLDRMPEIALVDILRTVTVDALKEDWTVMSKQEKGDAFLKILFSHISEISMILANAKTKIRINDTVIKAPAYVAQLKGEAKAEPTAKGRFLGSMELDVSNGNKIINRLINRAQKKGAKKFLSIVQKLKETQKTSGVASNSENYIYRLVVGYDGRFRLNGNDLGPLLPEDTKFELTPPLTERKIDKYETRKINLSPKPAELQANDNQGFRQRLERVKKLLEQELITPDEAASKRKEILKGL